LLLVPYFEKVATRHVWSSFHIPALPGWKQDTSNAQSLNDLPENALNYINAIEQLCGIPVSWVGVGASRGAMLKAWLKPE
jgi:adenylosuccinate synthase